jgi:branched-chain amino acid transport system substrate-binding protein
MKRKPIMSFWIWPWAVLAGLLFLTGCGGQAETPPILIGHVAPLSGADKAVGQSARRGIRLAVEEANKDPETTGAGRRVLVLHTDTHGDPKAFGAEATRLIKVNHVTALLGGLSADDMREFKLLDRAGAILISASGLVDQSLDGQTVFYTGLSPINRGQALARFAADKRFNHVVVLFDEDDPTGRCHALAEAFKDKFLELTGKEEGKRRSTVTGCRRFGKQTPIGTRAKRIADEWSQPSPDNGPRPDAILLAGKPVAVKRLRESLGKSGPSIPVLFGGGERGLAELLEERETSNEVFLATAFTPDAGTDRIRGFVKRYKDRFGEDPDVHAALAYDDARMLFAAMRQARELEDDVIRKGLAGLKDFAALTGPLSFDRYNQARRTVNVVGIHAGKPSKAARYPLEK